MNGVKSILLPIWLLSSGCAQQPDKTEAAAATTPRPHAVGAYSTPEEPPLIDVLQGPAFTLFTVAPTILNDGEVLRARKQEFAAHLKEAGLSGTVKVWFLLDDEGRVLSRVIGQSSGVVELDAAALRVAQVYRFSQAMNRDEAVYVWILMPIQFGDQED